MLLLAYVLAAPNFSPYDTLVIDTGVDTGIFPGARVMIDGGFVIGTVSEVLPTSAVVELFSSPGVVKQVIVGSSRIPAVAHGIGGGDYRIELPKNTDITEGDEVRIQGTAADYLGVVERMIIDEKSGITTLYLRLPINMTELDFVVVDLNPPLYE
jgi:cell shape-determining protein MreC